MKCIQAIAALGIAGSSILAAAPIATADPVPPTVTCTYGLQSGLATKVCAEITGENVRLFGQVGLAGPPSPGSPLPQPKPLILQLSGNVAGVSLGAVTQNAIFQSTTIQVSGVGGSVTCGSTIHGSFAVASYQWPSNPVTIDLDIPC
ncbi:hypothetical protein OG948_41725 (plasmid) [Embleya sp. NBC_00888]|uniref:hypothetical protein n=1 Tax=Embleya sp. NBC_00888 TaxID=2975960 RepID=UPI002F9097F6|nr:hypothetical protein OG948_41725 [Embleya sp. NBC_00888]